MPLGTDLVTWAPREGAAGDDRYNWAYLADPQLLSAGPQAYSSTPTLAEVNAGSGMNQIIAECNRRAKLYVDTRGQNSGFGWLSALSVPLSYVNVGDRITNTMFQTIKTYIATLRSAESQAAYTFDTDWSLGIGSQVKNVRVKDLRKALAFDRMRCQLYWADSPATFAPETRLGYSKGTYPPDVSGSFSNTAAGAQVGQILSGNYFCNRLALNYRLPASLPTIAAAKYLVLQANRTFGTSDFVVEVWKSNTYFGTPVAAAWPRTDSGGNTFTLTGSFADYTVDVPVPFLAGNNYSLLLCSRQERLDSFSTESGNFSNSLGHYLDLFV